MYVCMYIGIHTQIFVLPLHTMYVHTYLGAYTFEDIVILSYKFFFYLGTFVHMEQITSC
jgi:hypothetical protein